VRLDHLLSKEHHVMHPVVGCGREESLLVVGGGWVHLFFCGEGKTAGTLLGPEATPLLFGCVVAPVLVVGCGV
jgi:hypothetical protein